MYNIIKLFNQDLKRMMTHYSALIVILALCLLPSLYAWFNIGASWDPYSEKATSGIKIGVVNKDKGTEFDGEPLNLGNQVIDELKVNHLLGWQFVSEEESLYNLENGKYYAMITIPENFSSSLTSILTEDIQKAEIIYSVNEKINAIAPKLTDKGATGVQANISKAVVETISDTLFSIAKDIGIELENQIPKISSIYNSLVSLQGKFGKINETTALASEEAVNLEALIADLQESMPVIKDTLSSTQELSAAIEDVLAESQNAVNAVAPTLKKDIELITDISLDIADYTDSVIDAIQSASPQLPELMDQLIKKFTSVEKLTQSVVKLLRILNNIGPIHALTPTIENLENMLSLLDDGLSALNKISEDLANGYTPDLSVLENVKEIAQDVANMSSRITNNFDSAILPQINQLFDLGYDVVENALIILKDAENHLPQVDSILTAAYEGLQLGVEALDRVKEILPKAEEIVNELVDKLGKVENNSNLQELVQLLQDDVEKRTDFLANPVIIKEEKFFPIANYGTAMTPFYSVLSLWVGLLLCVSVLSVETPGEYKPYEVYFGKLLLFLGVAMIQGLIVALGDLYLLKITCLNPVLFVVGCIFTSVVFTFIVYSFVSVFGNVGKVFAIILLVLQVAASGGTFPIQLTPPLFQAINPYLPFTYAISFAREAIGGVVRDVLLKDIFILCVFILGSILLGVVCKKPINKLLHKFVENFEESGLA